MFLILNLLIIHIFTNLYLDNPGVSSNCSFEFEVNSESEIDPIEFNTPTQKANEQAELTRGLARTLTLDHGTNIIGLKRNESKVGLIFQLRKNMTVIDSTLTISGMPSFDFNTWEDLAVISTDIMDGTSVEPAISVDNQGKSHIVWRDNGDIEGSGTDNDIVYTRNLGDSWQKFRVVSTAKQNSYSKSPDIVVDLSNRVHFVWEDDVNYQGNGTDSDIFYRFKEDSGNDINGQEVWSNIYVISNETGFGYSLDPKITVNSSGDVFIVWADNETVLSGGDDFDIFCRIIHKEDLSWSPTYILSNDINDGISVDPDIATDGDNVYVVWTDDGDIQGSGDDEDIIMRKWNGSAWEASSIISDDLNDNISKFPVIDANEGIICVAWEDTGDIKGCGHDPDIIMKRFENSNWTASEVITDFDGDSDSISTDPELDIDHDGNIHVVWSDDVIFGADPIDTDIFYRRWDHLTNNWSNYILISNNPQNADSYAPTICVNKDLRVEILWEDNSNIDGSGFDPDILYRGSKFIYPINLKLWISSVGDNTTKSEKFDWIYPGILDHQITINDSRLPDKLNSLIASMEHQECNYTLIFASETNSSIKILKFETTLTSTPEPPNNLRVLGEDKDHVISHNPKFGWTFVDQDSPVQAGFAIQVGSTPAVSDMWDYGPVTTNDEFKIYNGKPLLDNQTYYFRVRTRDSYGAWSKWSVSQYFTMNAKPEMVYLKPVTGTADDYIDIKWLGKDGNDDDLIYTLEAHYNNKLHTLLVNSTATTYHLNTSNVQTFQTVDFKVKCYDGYEGSETWYNPDGSITIIHNNPPSVVIVDPPKGNALANQSYQLSWNSFDLDAEDALWVDIYYDKDKNFSNDNKKLITKNLLDNGQYLWNTSKVENGIYYICVVISDNKSSSYKYSEGTITIDHNIVTDPPRVLETIPKADEVNVSVTQDIRVKFNKEIDTKTLYGNFTIEDSLGREVGGYIYTYYDGRNTEMIFYPDQLDYSQQYIVTICAGIRDTDGNQLDGNGDNIPQASPEDDYVWSFITKPRGITPPHIKSVSPKDLSTDINVNTIIVIIFSDNIKWDQFSPTNIFILDPQGNFINKEIYYFEPDKELRISFIEDLEFETEYTVLISAAIHDVSGNGLDGNNNGVSEGSPVDDYVWSFTTKESEQPEVAESQKEEFDPFNYYFIILTIIVLILVLVLILLIKKNKQRKFVINDIFVIYNDGRLLAHQSYESKSNVDKGSMGGMLTAIQNFIQEAFIDSDSEILDEIKYGKLRIVMVHGKNIYFAVICTGELDKRKLHKDMRNILTVIEYKYGKALASWDGNMRALRGIQDLIRF